MKNLLYSIVALVVLSIVAIADGVMNGSTWNTATGSHSVTVGLEAQTSGNHKVTFTEGTNSGSTDWGTPDPNGGCAECPSVGVGTESYRIKDKGSYSVVQWKNANGDWITLGKKPEKKKKGEAAGMNGSLTDGDDHDLSFGGNSVGSLPVDSFFGDDEAIGTLPMFAGDEGIGALPAMASDDEYVGTLP